MTNAVIYARYSTEMQSQGHSIEGQILACKNYAKKHKLKIVKIYTDEAITGQIKNRAAFQGILKDARLGKFEAVIVHALSRTTRFQDLFDYYLFKNDLKKCNVVIHSTTENILDEDVGELIEFISVWQSKNDIIKISQNVMRTMLYNASLAKFNGGVPPLGLSVNKDNEYIINEEEAKIIRHIFDLYIKGYGYTAIARKLKLFNYKNRQGGYVTRSAIREYLTNKKYIGTYEYNRVPKRDKYGSRNNHASKREEDIVVIENAFPAIINKTTWDKAQKIFNSGGRSVYNSIKRKDVYLLSGIVKCGCCGSAYSGRYVKLRDIFYYTCGSQKNVSLKCNNSSVQRDVLENSIFEYLNYLCSDKMQIELCKWYKKNYNILMSELDNSLDILIKRKKELQEQLELFVMKLLEFDSDTIRNKINQLENDISEIDNYIFEEKKTAEKYEGVKLDKFIQYLNIIKNIKDLSREEQKFIMHHFIKQITINPTENKSIKIIEIKSTLAEQLGLTDESECFTLSGAEGSTPTKGKQIPDFILCKKIIYAKPRY